jgi:hypothetical protein
MKNLILLLTFITSIFFVQAQTPACNSWLSTPANGSFVQVGSLDITGNQLTVEALYYGTDAQLGKIVSKHTTALDVNYSLMLIAAEITTINGTYQVASAPLCNGTTVSRIYHVAMVYDGTSLRFYRNGFLLDTQPASGNLVTNTWPTTIGTGPNNPPNTMQSIGFANEVRIWNVARTQAQIRQFMYTSLPNPATQFGLQGYYNFNSLNNLANPAQFNGVLSGGAIINQNVPNCNYVADTCCAANTNSTQTKCSNQSITLNARPAGTTYAWLPATGLSATNIQNPVCTATSNTTYTVTVTNTTTNCTNVDVVNVNVNTAPQSAIPDTSLCKGDTIQLFAAGGTSYNWLPAYNINNTTIFNPKVWPLVDTSYIVTITNSNACTIKDTIRIKVNDCGCNSPCYWKVTGNNILNGNNILGTLTNDDIKLFSNNTQRGVIKNNGYFGWQTNAPSTLFHVDCINPALGIPSNLRFQNLLKGKGNPLVVDNNGYVSIGIAPTPGLVNNCGTLNFVPKTGNPGFLDCSQIYDDGNFVGIATTTPFNVNGTNSRLNVNGLTVTNTLYTVSDEKYKKNITDITDATAIINKLRGVTYNWDTDGFKEKNFEKGTQAGFLAQEVNKAFPVAVAVDEKANFVLNYNSFIPLLTKGQQEINDLITQLYKQNAELKNDVNSLKNQLRVLSAKNNMSTTKLEDKIFVDQNKLYQNRPNPFNDATVIEYEIAQSYQSAHIIVYDLNGKELLKFIISNNKKGTVQVNAKQLSSGMYLYALVIDGKEIETKKMILSKN